MLKRIEARLTPRALWAAAWFLLFLTLLVTYIQLNEWGWTSRFYHADIFLPAYYRDFVAGADLRQWAYPPAPYVFPDMFIYFPLNALIADFRVALPLMGAVQYTLFILGLVLVASRLSKELLLQSLVLLAGTICLLVFSRDFAFLFMLLLSVDHFGVFMVIPWAIWLILILLNDGAPRIAWIALCIVAALTAGSDLLFLVQMILPFLFLMFLFTRRLGLPFKRMLRIAFALVLSGAMGAYGITALLNLPLLRNPDALSPGAPTGFAAISGWYAWFWANYPVLAFVWSAFLLCATLRLAIAVGRKRDLQMQSTHTLLVLALLWLSVGINLGASGFGGNIDTNRRLMPTFFIPIIFGWPFLIATLPMERINRRASRLALTGVIAILIMAQLAPLRNVAVLGAFAAQKMEMASCLDSHAAENGLRYGMAQYWVAKPLSQYSQTGLHVVQVTNDFQPYYWIVNRAEFQNPMDFIITSSGMEDMTYQITEAMVIARFGPPAKRFECGAESVLVYNRDSDSAFRNLFINSTNK